jgi:hypothetical protein
MPKPVISAHLPSRVATASAPIANFFVPEQPTRLIAEGVTEGNVRWSLRVGGDDANHSTMLRIEDESGLISEGGMRDLVIRRTIRVWVRPRRDASTYRVALAAFGLAPGLRLACFCLRSDLPPWLAGTCSLIR